MTHIWRYGIHHPSVLTKVRRMIRNGFKDWRIAADCGITVAAVRAVRREGK